MSQHETLPLSWLPSPSRGENLVAAYRGRFRVEAECEAEVRIFGCHYFEASLDGEHFAEGPWRFPIDAPQYESRVVRLAPGEHLLAAAVWNIGINVEYIRGAEIPPCFGAEVRIDGKALPVQWTCRELDAYEHRGRRMSNNLAWMEWCDGARLPQGWMATDLDAGADWVEPAECHAFRDAFTRVDAAPIARVRIPLEPIASGALYAHDIDLSCEEPHWAFYSRRMDDPDPNGCWFRFDLGRVALGKLELDLEAPEGAMVVMACSDFLVHGRVSPWIVESHGPTANMNFHRARGGREAIRPLGPRGGRYWEAHIQAPKDQVRLRGAAFLERTSAPRTRGAFDCGDSKLGRLWAAGVDTLRACTEDAVVDCPTRERGQWTGDSLTVGMETAFAAGHDLRIFARAMRQAAHCAREDGMIPGLFPGVTSYLPTYALHWAAACWRYLEMTGVEAHLHDLHPAARRNLRAFTAHLGADGLLVPGQPEGWSFVDWGYAPKPDTPLIPQNALLLDALRAMAKWSERVGASKDHAEALEHADAVRGGLRRWLEVELGKGGWDGIGYHEAVFLARSGIVAEDERDAALDRIARWIQGCFPNDSRAPRLGSPSTHGDRFLTPFFLHFVLPGFAEGGWMDFALSQFRSAWGWALERSSGTLLEVFDPNWSHCHQWSSCPTWMMSRYLLGLNPRYDLGRRTFDLGVADCLVPEARGVVPLPGEDAAARIAWTREDGMLDFRIECAVPIRLRLLGQSEDPAEVREVVVQGAERFRLLWPCWPSRAGTPREGLAAASAD